MADLDIYRGLSENLDNVPIVDGNIIITKDDGKIYADVGEERIPLGEDDLPLEKGEAEYAVKQSRHPDNTDDKLNHAYQRGGIALGGATQAGVTEEEYNTGVEDNNNKYKQWDGEKYLEYNETFGFNLAQGDTTKARGRNAAAFNLRTEAEGKNSFATGDTTKANGENAASFGFKTQANGTNAATFGLATIMNANHGFACGVYNENLENSIFEVGAGKTDGSWKSNALSVNTDGVTITKHIQPRHASQYNIGSASLRYVQIYTHTIDASSGISINQGKVTINSQGIIKAKAIESEKIPAYQTDVVRLKELNEAEARINAKIPTPTPRIVVDLATQSLPTMQPNTYYVITDFANRADDLTITLGTPTNTNIVNEYKFRITYLASSNLRIEISGVKGLPEVYEQGKTYEISIIDGYAVYTVWE